MDLTEIVCVIDRSGSMSAVIGDAIGGFNTFLKEQQEMNTPAIMTVVLFNEGYKLLHDGSDIKSVKPFDGATYVPAGMTALFDAVGKTITALNERVEKAADKEKIPNKILYVILTDGHENSSREFRKEQIITMIETEKKKGREVIFLGADATSFDPGFVAAVGGMSNVMQFAPTSAGTHSAYRSMSSACASYRMSSDIGDWKSPKKSKPKEIRVYK
jgi:uncharacterized protein YegL